MVYYRFCFSVCTGELQVNVKGGCQLEGTVLGAVMGQEGRERDALSIDYRTEHPCALAGLRLCRRTKP